MKKTAFLLALLILSATGFSQTKPTEEHIKTLLEVTGSANLGLQMMNNMASSLKKSVPNVPDEFWEEFIKEARPDTLISLMIPVYSKHYSDEEIVQLIEFYKTPLGKKLVEKMPLIMQESFTAGEGWGKKTAADLIKKLTEKGYIPKE